MDSYQFNSTYHALQWATEVLRKHRFAQMPSVYAEMLRDEGEGDYITEWLGVDDTTQNKHIIGTTFHKNATGTPLMANNAIQFENGNAATGFQVFFSSGNITDGKIEVWRMD